MATAGTTEHALADVAALAKAAADCIAVSLAQGGALVLTGGSTVGPLYDELSTRDLPWDRVQATLSDERWVPTDSPDSNEHLVRTRLMRGGAAALRLTGLKTDAATPTDAAQAVDTAVAALPRPFACVLLGMGEDGHVASLFPGDAAPESLDAAGPRLVAPAVAPNGVQRLSLTMRALTDTHRIVLLVRGEAKRALVKDALSGGVPHLPIAALLRQAQCPVEVFWAP